MWQSLDVALDNLDVIIEKAGEMGVESVMNVVCWLFQRVLENNTPPAEAVNLVDKFAKKLTSNSKSNPILRLKTLSTIYNVLGGNGTARYNVFVAIVTFAAASGKEQLTLLAPQFAQLDDMLAEWGTDVAKTRDLFKIIFDAMAKYDNKEGAHDFRLKFLKTFAGDSNLAASKEQAKTVVVEAIANPKIFHFDTYLELDAIAALQKDAADAKAFELLKLFAGENLDAFNKFYAANSAYVGGLGLNKEECVVKMRLLTLCSLASDKPEVTYAEIAKALEVSEGEVEPWAIKAITGSLMDAKMDQLNKTLVVSRCKERSFSQEQWTSLRNKLVGWKDQMKQLMQVIENTRKEQAQQMAAMQTQIGMNQ
jgi:translation initiation factor 3 subunit M